MSGRVIPPQVREWQRQGALEWRCHYCGLILGYLLDGVFCSYHARREMRIPLAGQAVQVCDRCGHENHCDPDKGPLLDA